MKCSYLKQTSQLGWCAMEQGGYKACRSRRYALLDQLLKFSVTRDAVKLEQ